MSQLGHADAEAQPLAERVREGGGEDVQAAAAKRAGTAASRPALRGPGAGAGHLTDEPPPADRGVELQDAWSDRGEARRARVARRDPLQRGHRADARELVAEATGDEAVHRLVAGGSPAPCHRLGEHPELALPRQQRRRDEIPRGARHRVQPPAAIDEAAPALVAGALHTLLEAEPLDQLARLRAARRQGRGPVLERVAAFDRRLHLPAGAAGGLEDGDREVGTGEDDRVRRGEPAQTPADHDDITCVAAARHPLVLRRRAG